jgi:hypothetical protein
MQSKFFLCFMYEKRKEKLFVEIILRSFQHIPSKHKHITNTEFKSKKKIMGKFNCFFVV